VSFDHFAGRLRAPIDVVLRDGSTARIRPACEADRSELEWLLQELSPRSQRLRFGGPLSTADLSAEAARLSSESDGRRFDLVATVGEPERVIAHACYETDASGRSRVFFVVSDAYQGRGLGSLLLLRLAEAAKLVGIPVLTADVIPENYRMIDVIEGSGFPVEVDVQPGRLSLTFPVEMTPAATARFEARDRTAAAQAVRSFLNPTSVALIGASRNRESIPGAIFHNLLSYGFAGPVYPINPGARVVQSVLAYPSVEEVPEDVELAIIAVPAERVDDVVTTCARKGVRALVVISAGFAETGEEGRQRQQALLRRCRAEGMRMIGPNCMGILNTAPGTRLDATFAPQPPPAGRIGFASQSGALGLAVIEFAEQFDLGISSFVSLGNKADISGNDLLAYWHEDDDTDVILLYLESFGNPRKFSRIARHVGETKPIVAVKSGRSQAGARAASSHTGALLASSDATVDALFRQSGVIRTDTLAEMFDVASLLASQPLPAGRRIAVVTNAGGPGILCADTLEAEGMNVPELSQATQESLREFLPPHAGTSNPVDLIASATSDHYRRAIDVVLSDDSIDGMIVINIPIVEPAETVASIIASAAAPWTGRKPMLLVAMTSERPGIETVEGAPRLPLYAFPEAAARALARAVRYAEWRARPGGDPPEFSDIRQAEAAAIVARALEEGEGWLSPEDCWALLDCYGVPVAPQRVVPADADLEAAARDLGDRLVLKAIAPNLLHKTEAGAVRVGLEPHEVEPAAVAMHSRLESLGHAPEGWIVQAMAAEGVEMLVGAVNDPQFGPVIACGTGGVMVELMQDIAFRLAPLTARDASELLGEVKGSRLLAGFRGSPPRDAAALEDALLRVSHMVEDLPQIQELDCNPVLIHEHGATVVDARVRLAPVAPPVPLGARGFAAT
jgi:acetate---CoA ligase (ADP-forming)